jgi:hypothetical protein
MGMSMNRLSANAQTVSAEKNTGRYAELVDEGNSRRPERRHRHVPPETAAERAIITSYR